MKKIDQKKSEAFSIQTQFGSDTNEERIHKLYPERTKTQIQKFYKTLEDAESQGQETHDAFFMKE